MTGLIDTNILVYTANTSSPHHTLAQKFIQTVIETGSAIYICLPVVYEFLRITTHPRVFQKPLTWQKAWAFIHTLLSCPNIRLLRETADHIQTLQDILLSLSRAQGNLFHDCHIAAIMKEHGVKTIFTRDSDFRLFDFLKAVDPL